MTAGWEPSGGFCWVPEARPRGPGGEAWRGAAGEHFPEALPEDGGVGGLGSRRDDDFFSALCFGMFFRVLFHKWLVSVRCRWFSVLYQQFSICQLPNDLSGGFRYLRCYHSLSTFITFLVLCSFPVIMANLMFCRAIKKYIHPYLKETNELI